MTQYGDMNLYQEESLHVYKKSFLRRDKSNLLKELTVFQSVYRLPRFRLMKNYGCEKESGMTSNYHSDI